jgi:alkane 1-monooxygenase
MTAKWSDPKRYLWLLSPFIPLLGVLVLILYAFTGWNFLVWGGPFLVYVVVPVLDWLGGADQSNPPESAAAQLEADRYYRFVVYAYLPSQLIVTIWAAWLVAQGFYEHRPLWQLVGLIISVGTINGLAFIGGHELCHKRDSQGRWMSKLMLAPTAYGHFYTEHVRGHHKNVATPEDPASARMGESFWRFLPRTMIGSLISAWKIERNRLNRQGKSVWSWENDNLQAWFLTVIFFGALTLWLGWIVLPFLLLQAFYAISLLEVINYIEHYGLLRQKTPDGRYEHCTPAHSWNSNYIITNLVLYQLQRHSDHHAHPTRSYQALRHFDDSPQLPSGYASMLIPAYIPWMWFRQMDPLVMTHYKGDLTRANLQPSKREKLLRKAAAFREQRAIQEEGAQPPPPQEAIAAPPAAAAASTNAMACYRCPDCGYVYDESQGCPNEGFPPGTRWSQIPDSWSCPGCSVRDKVDFIRIS